MPPALNSAKESPTFLKYHDWGGSRRGFCFVMVSHRAPPLPWTYKVPWAAALKAPLVTSPSTVIFAPQLSHPTSSEALPLTRISVPGIPMLPSRCPDVPSTVIITLWLFGQILPPMPCCPSAMTRSSLVLSCTACCICSSSMRDGTLLPFTIPFIVTVLSFVFLFSPFAPLTSDFCFLARITYPQPLCHCFVVGAQSVGHADGKLGAPAHRSKYLPQFNVGSLKDLHHAFRNLIGIKPPVQLRVLRGYTTRTFSGITEIAAVIFVAQAVGCRLHYVLAYGNHR